MLKNSQILDFPSTLIIDLLGDPAWFEVWKCYLYSKYQYSYPIK